MCLHQRDSRRRDRRAARTRPLVAAKTSQAALTPRAHSPHPAVVFVHEVGRVTAATPSELHRMNSPTDGRVHVWYGDARPQVRLTQGVGNPEREASGYWHRPKLSRPQALPG